MVDTFLNSMPKLRTRWNTVKNVAGGAEGLNVIGAITELTQADVINYIRNETGDNLTLNINSYGGDFYAGLGVYNTLRQDGRPIVTNNLALSASAASIIFLAGNTRNAFAQSSVMMHNAMMITAGNAAQLRADADSLASADEQIRAIVSENTNLSNERMDELFMNETFITANDQVSMGITNNILSQTDEDEDKDDEDNKSTRNEILVALKNNYFKGVSNGK